MYIIMFSYLFIELKHALAVSYEVEPLAKVKKTKKND